MSLFMVENLIENGFEAFFFPDIYNSDFLSIIL